MKVVWHTIGSDTKFWHTILSDTRLWHNSSQSEIYRSGNVDYAWKSLIIADEAWNWQWSEKIESWLTSIIKEFFYIGKCNFKQQWLSLAFTSGPYMVMKIIGIPTVFDDSQLLADYHWHFHASRWSCPFMQLIIVWILKANAHTHTHTHTHTHCRLDWQSRTGHSQSWTRVWRDVDNQSAFRWVCWQVLKAKWTLAVIFICNNSIHLNEIDFFALMGQYAMTKEYL